MKMWSVGVLILLLFCYACLSIEAGNGRVHFISRNFNNTLHWEAVEPSYPGEEMLYSVQYWSDATGQYQIKEECQNITDLSCDLTEETPSLPELHYHAQVSVNGRLIGRTNFRFNPLEQTILGRPTLSINTTGSSLYVNVTLPSGPKGASIADIISNSKHVSSKNAVIYILKITKPHWAALVNETTNGRFVINLKNNKTQYCGYVVYRPHLEWGREESENASFCITLPDNHQAIFTWLFASVALLVVIITISVMLMCRYVRGGKKTKLPTSLETNFGNSCKVQSADRCITSIPVVLSAYDPTVYATIQMKPNVPFVNCGGYSPQDIPCHAWQGNTGSSVDTVSNSLMPRLLDVSAQSSEIYGAVAAHVLPAEGNEDFQQPTMEDRATCTIPLLQSTPKLILAGEPPSLDVDNCDSKSDGPLMLHTVLDTNGQLTLPSLTMLQSSMDHSASPLLSDVIMFNMETPFLASFQRFDSSEWSDSGCDDSSLNTATQQYCNSNYFPSQPVSPYSHQQSQITQCSKPNFESGYKQNWMPEMFLQSASKDAREYIRTNNH